MRQPVVAVGTNTATLWVQLTLKAAVATHVLDVFTGLFTPSTGMSARSKKGWFRKKSHMVQYQNVIAANKVRKPHVSCQYRTWKLKLILPVMLWALRLKLDFQSPPGGLSMCNTWPTLCRGVASFVLSHCNSSTLRLRFDEDWGASGMWGVCVVVWHLSKLGPSTPVTARPRKSLYLISTPNVLQVRFSWIRYKIYHFKSKINPCYM